MRKASYVLLIVPPVLLASCVWLVWRGHVDWDRAEQEHQRWGPTRRANKLVMRDIESMKDAQGRYPEVLTPADLRETGEDWYYRPSADRLDYELWCKVPREDGGFDALVFSPDGLISTDWPNAPLVAGDVWTFVEHAERAPSDRWQGPINP